MMRLTRSGMVDALRADYIRTARAKGLGRLSIVGKHALRNAAMPLVAIAAVQLGFMLGGSIVVEAVFNLPGLGYLAWESISKNDFPVVQAVVLILAVIYVGLTLAADLLNARARPAAAHGLTAWSRRDLGLAILLFALATAAFGPSLVPHDPYTQDLSQRLVPPAWMEGGSPAHWLGTDQLGPRLPGAAGRRVAHLAADRGCDGAGVGRDRHRARHGRRLLRRRGGRGGDVRHHLPPRHPDHPGGADRGGAGRQFAHRGRADARAAVVGPVRRRGAHHHDAGPHARLRRRPRARPGPGCRTSCCGRCCPTSPPPW